MTPWRTGRKVGRTIYNSDDELIGVMDTPELATAVVDAVNAKANGHEVSAQRLASLRETCGREPRLGCSLTAHRDIGFCRWCPGLLPVLELEAWTLLAMAQRGVPPQPSG